jgi:hypothetical protein
LDLLFENIPSGKTATHLEGRRFSKVVIGRWAAEGALRDLEDQ